MALLFSSELTGKYGYESLLQPLIEDMKIMETIGIEITLEGRTHIYRGTITMVVADNLASHVLGGFFCNFSTVKKFCRFCSVSKQVLKEHPMRKDWVLRSRAGYDSNIAQLVDDPEIAPAYGIKSNSCLNELSYFHAAEGLPTDLAHDDLEGIAVNVISDIVGALVGKKYFSLPELNNIISVFQYARIDKANKPQPLKLISGINFKVKQTACEMWNLIRLLPLMIGEKVDENDEVWKCYIKFVILVERLSASSFSDSDLIVLDLLTDEFFLSYLESFPDVNLKPKAHFLRHYSYMIRRFGPLVKTLRFESKHQTLNRFHF